MPLGEPFWKTALFDKKGITLGHQNKIVPKRRPKRYCFTDDQTVPPIFFSAAKFFKPMIDTETNILIIHPLTIRVVPIVILASAMSTLFSHVGRFEHIGNIGR